MLVSIAAALLLGLLLGQPEPALAWRLPSSPVNPFAAATGPRGAPWVSGPRRQDLPLLLPQAAVYSSSPPLEPVDGQDVPLGPVATPAGYKFEKYDGEQISKLAVRQWWRVLARLNGVGPALLSWYAMVRSDEVRSS